MVKDLRQVIRLTRWRARNFRRVLARYGDAQSDRAVRSAGELRREGIVIHRPGQSFDRSIFDEALARAMQLKANEQAEATESKGYRLHLLPTAIHCDDPLLRLALDPYILSIASRYMGMAVYLRAIDLWLDRPTSEPAKETQLWHRDGDDVLNVKVFVYLNDVDRETGPFCFIPRSHPFGDRRWLAPESEKGRATDEAMARLVPPEEWRINTAPAGTTILCDTSGYHKGLKPTGNQRLMLTWQYTSGTAWYARAFELLGTPSFLLTQSQRYTLAG